MALAINHMSDRLMRRVLAGDVAATARDTLVLVDARLGDMVEVQELPVGDIRHRAPDEVVDVDVPVGTGDVEGVAVRVEVPVLVSVAVFVADAVDVDVPVGMGDVEGVGVRVPVDVPVDVPVLVGVIVAVLVVGGSQSVTLTTASTSAIDSPAVGPSRADTSSTLAVDPVCITSSTMVFSTGANTASFSASSADTALDLSMLSSSACRRALSCSREVMRARSDSLHATPHPHTHLTAMARRSI